MFSSYLNPVPYTGNYDCGFGSGCFGRIRNRQLHQDCGFGSGCFSAYLDPVSLTRVVDSDPVVTFVSRSGTVSLTRVADLEPDILVGYGSDSGFRIFSRRFGSL